MDGSEDPALGFIGLGRLGVPIASLLLEAGHELVCCSRGRSAELVAQGARIAGDGTPREVAEEADVLFTCLPGGEVAEVHEGPSGILAADGRLPVVVELSVAAIPVKLRLREELVRRGGDLLDCPVSGTPAMAASRDAVMYASGTREAFDPLSDLLRSLMPKLAYVGDVGHGMRMKYVANLLALVHVAAASEAMALADSFGLDPDIVIGLISKSPAATSGQFEIRAPMIAAGEFSGHLVDIRDAREVLGQVTAAARDAGTSAPLASTAKRLYDEMGDRGEDDSDPGKLAVFLRQHEIMAPDAAPVQADGDHARLHDQIAERVGRTHDTRLYIGLSRVNVGAAPPAPQVVLEHLDWAQRLEGEGVLFAAGPFVDDAGAILGDGMYVVHADDRAQAAELLATDPFERSGFRRCTVHGWTLHQGTLDVSVTRSDRTSSLG